jgi:hypothetical protein
MFKTEMVDKVGHTLVDIFHRLALFGIGAATVWAAGVRLRSAKVFEHAGNSAVYEGSVE